GSFVALCRDAVPADRDGFDAIAEPGDERSALCDGRLHRCKLQGAPVAGLILPDLRNPDPIGVDGVESDDVTQTPRQSRARVDQDAGEFVSTAGHDCNLSNQAVHEGLEILSEVDAAARLAEPERGVCAMADLIVQARIRRKLPAAGALRPAFTRSNECRT